jgi:hypothetical protein
MRPTRPTLNAIGYVNTAVRMAPTITTAQASRKPPPLRLVWSAGAGAIVDRTET